MISPRIPSQNPFKRVGGSTTKYSILSLALRSRQGARRSGKMCFLSQCWQALSWPVLQFHSFRNGLVPWRLPRRANLNLSWMLYRTEARHKYNRRLFVVILPHQVRPGRGERMAPEPRILPALFRPRFAPNHLELLHSLDPLLLGLPRGPL